MTIGKRKGRKPGKKAFELQATARRNRHWIDCQGDDCLESAEVDGDVIGWTCALCVGKEIPWPVAKQPLTTEEKKAKVERKAARLAKKEAIAAGTYVEPEKSAKSVTSGFGRGWHRCIVFSHLGEDGKEAFYSRGKKITKAQFTKLVGEHADKHAPKPTAEFGRGWHFRNVFVAPNGDVYNMGTLATKATKEPNETEFQNLMEQHAEAK